MTPRERVMKALRMEHLDVVPFTIYECMIPQCAAEREMRNNGLCIVNRTVPVVKCVKPNVKTTKRVYYENGREFTRTFHETPDGVLTMLYESAGFTKWAHEKLFKSRDDYKALLSFVRDAVYEPCYENFLEQEKALGDDVILRAGIGAEPLQQMMSGTIMAMETFCIEWMENRDEIIKLYDAFVENARKIYPLVADSPVSHVNYGGNIVPEIVSPEMFRTYYTPNYHEAAEYLRAGGKLLGSHLDANCGNLAKAIADSPLDYIEAFTPAPDTDMTLGEARAAWPDKALWLNFPSSVHLKNDQYIEQFTTDMLGQVDSTDGIIMGITEDMPPARWRDSCRAIMRGLGKRETRKLNQAAGGHP